MHAAPSISNREKETITLFKNGKKKAFEELYDVYAPLLYGGICRILGQTKTAEKVLQQSFIDIWQMKASYEPDKERIILWMMRFARKNSLLIKNQDNFQKDQPQTIAL